MHKFDKDARKEAWLLCAKRDGIRCNISKNPWYHGLNRNEIEQLAKRNGLSLPAGLSKEQFWQECDNPTGVFLVLAMKRLVVDHIDNDKTNNPADGSNWQLATQSENVKKRITSLGRKPKTPSIIKYQELKKSIYNKQTNSVPRDTPLQMVKNLEAEPFIRHFFDCIIDTYHPKSVNKDDLVNAAAEAFTKETKKTISQQAVRGYLEKRLNPINGSFEVDPDQEEAHIRRRSTPPIIGTKVK